ncbi:MAG: sensor histidine kinase [Magnetococcales bacterium]|nr:sensor histidine kinase [Magnetococcales bacterium]
MKSVASQLQVGLSGLLISVFLILFAVNDHVTFALANALQWQEISRKAEYIRSILLHSLKQGHIPESPCLDAQGSGFYCQWEWQQEGVRQVYLSPSLEEMAIALPDMAGDGSLELKLHHPKGGELRVVTFVHTLPKGKLLLAVAQSDAVQKNPLRKWRFYHLFLTFFIILIFIALVYWYVQLQFDVFGRLQREVKQWQIRHGVRMLPNAPEEVKPLLQILEQQRAMEERSLHRLRRTLGQIGHTLKIPITVLFHLAEAPEMQQLPKLRAVLTEQTHFLESVLERHLRRASLAGPNPNGEFFRLEQEMATLVRALDMLYYDKGLEISVRVAKNLCCPGNREDFLELFGNLADNACKWAKSRIIISAGNETGFWLTLEDDGPGVAEEQLAILRQWRGKRFDENRPGQGLGLVIAHDIVAFYEGELTLARSTELGGFMVSIRLPHKEECLLPGD